jgi:hypothetical protein
MMQVTRETGYARNASESAYPNLWRGLAGWWCPSINPRGGNRLFDLSPNQNHGTLVSMANDDWVVSGGQGALDFDAANDFVSIPIRAFPARFPFAMSCWFRVPDTTTFRVLASITRPGVDFAWFGINTLSSGFVNVAEGDNILTSTADSTTQYTTGWNHILGIFESASLRRVVLNGKGEGINTATRANTLATFTGISLSALRRSSDAFYGSQLDDFRIYDRVPTPSEICLLASSRGIGLQPRPKQYTYTQQASGARRRRILTGMV